MNCSSNKCFRLYLRSLALKSRLYLLFFTTKKICTIIVIIKKTHFFSDLIHFISRILHPSTNKSHLKVYYTILLLYFQYNQRIFSFIHFNFTTFLFEMFFIFIESESFNSIDKALEQSYFIILSQLVSCFCRNIR